MALASIGFHWHAGMWRRRPCGPFRCRHRCHGAASMGAELAALDEATASTPAVSTLVGFPSAAGPWKVASTSCPLASFGDCYPRVTEGELCSVFGASVRLRILARSLTTDGRRDTSYNRDDTGGSSRRVYNKDKDDRAGRPRPGARPHSPGVLPPQAPPHNW
jgi:hypothetical protein